MTNSFIFGGPNNCLLSAEIMHTGTVPAPRDEGHFAKALNKASNELIVLLLPPVQFTLPSPPAIRPLWLLCELAGTERNPSEAQRGRRRCSSRGGTSVRRCRLPSWGGPLGAIAHPLTQITGRACCDGSHDASRDTPPDFASSYRNDPYAAEA